MSGWAASISRARASSNDIGSTAVPVATGGRISGARSHTVTARRPLVVRSSSNLAEKAAISLPSVCGFLR